MADVDTRRDVNTEIEATPLPSARERRHRSSLFRQAGRFVVLNAKIFALSRQHH
jgi:hypothetical protein